MLKKLFLFLFVIFFAKTVSAQPLNAKFYTNTFDATVGDELNLQLKINPRTDMPVYTVSADLIYDPEVLEFVSADYTDDADVFGVQKPPYFLEDTDSGMIRLTAGFPEGADSLRNFTTYKFKAKKNATTKIYIQNGEALNAENINIGLQQKEITINISDKLPETTTEPEKKIFDIELKLDILGPIAIYKEEAYTFPIDTFGTVDDFDSTIKIFVYNQKTELYFQDEKKLETQNAEPISFTIPAYTLDEGNYLISIETVDSEGQSRIIAQKEIGVLSNGENWFTRNKDYILPIFFFIAVVSILHHLAKERDLYFKLKELQRGRPKTTKRVIKKVLVSRRF